MGRAIWRLIIIGLLALAILIPQGIAFAGMETSDNGCPPRAQAGTNNASQTGLDVTYEVEPPAPPKAWSITTPSGFGTNTRK